MYICYISKNNNFTKNIPVIIFFNIKRHVINFIFTRNIQIYQIMTKAIRKKIPVYIIIVCTQNIINIFIFYIS